MSMPMSLLRNSFRSKENLHMEKLLLCTHCIYYIYSIYLQAFPKTRRLGSRGVPGRGKDEEKLARIHLCKHFQQQTSYLHVYYQFSPCFWGPTSHRWPSPDRKGKKDVGREKKDQDSEVSNVINVNLFSKYIRITSHTSGLQNHRMVCVGKDFKGHLHTAMLPWAGTSSTRPCWPGCLK